MKKIVYLAVSLMALMAVSGVVTAYWTDQLKIDGEINTGTFGWELSLDGIQTLKDEKGITFAGAKLKDYVDGHPKTLRFEVNELYPGVVVLLDWDIHFYGTIPGHIDEGDITWTLTVDGVDQGTTIPDWLYLAGRVMSKDFIPNNGPPNYIDTSNPVPLEKNDWYCLPDFLDLIDDTQWHESNALFPTFMIVLVEPGMTYKGGAPIPVTSEPPQGAKIVLTIMVNGVQYNFGEGFTPPVPMT